MQGVLPQNAPLFCRKTPPYFAAKRFALCGKKEFQ